MALVVVVVMVAALLAAIIAVAPWRRRARPSAKLTAAAGMEELHGLLSLGKRYEFEQRRIVYSLRDESEADGSPNGIDLDLANGIARFSARLPPDQRR